MMMINQTSNSDVCVCVCFFLLSIEIGPPNQAMPLGNLIYKVGIATGFKIGTRAPTCVNDLLGTVGYPDPPPPNTVLICQYHTPQTPMVSGDSGGPAFFWDGFLPATAKFAGIYWGIDSGIAGAVYSPISGIKTDLGTLKYNVQ